MPHTRRTGRGRTERLLSERETNILTGKALVGAMTQEDQVRLTKHLALLYFKLDELDLDDYLGTEGWRRFFDLPED